jgi:hypothetical protein
MKQTYGSITLEVPKDFEDETIIILRAPPLPSTTPLRVPRGQTARPTFVVKRVALAADPLPLATLAKAEADMLTQTIPGLEISPHQELTLGATPAVLFEVAFAGPEGPMRQAHVSLVHGRCFLGFVATAADDLAFPSIRDRLLELAGSAEVASSPPDSI